MRYVTDRGQGMRLALPWIGQARRARPAAGRRCADGMVVWRTAATLSLCLLLSGCSLFKTTISVDGASPEDTARVSIIAISPRHPLFLRAVDGKPLPLTHVPDSVMPLRYILHPGAHVFWLTSVPSVIYPFPPLPQHLSCFVLGATLSAGSSYALRLDPEKDVPVLSHAVEAEPEIEGQLVDRPFLPARGCRWN